MFSLQSPGPWDKSEAICLALSRSGLFSSLVRFQRLLYCLTVFGLLEKNLSDNVLQDFFAAKCIFFRLHLASSRRLLNLNGFLKTVQHERFSNLQVWLGNL